MRSAREYIDLTEAELAEAAAILPGGIHDDSARTPVDLHKRDYHLHRASILSNLAVAVACGWARGR